MDLVPRSRTSVAEKLIDCCTNVGNHDTMCGPNTSSSTTSATAADRLSVNSSYCCNTSKCNRIEMLQKKKADVVSRLDRNLKVIQDEQIRLVEETTLNETLGVSLADQVKLVAKPQEVEKFKTHIQEVGYITSLLLNLGGRLAKAENTLLDLDADHPEKVLEEKKCKLAGQLEKAKELKKNIDRREDLYRSRYLTADEYSNYDHFIAMKAKLLIDDREISDKIQLGEEQLRALKETFEDKY